MRRLVTAEKRLSMTYHLDAPVSLSVTTLELTAPWKASLRDSSVVSSDRPLTNRTLVGPEGVGEEQNRSRHVNVSLTVHPLLAVLKLG